MGAFEVTMFFFGLVIIIIGISLNQKKCPPQKIQYIPVPRTFSEEMESPIPPAEIFKDMFERPTPFLAGFSIDSNPSKANQRFISQI